MSNERIFALVPNIAFRAVVADYAFFAGRVVFTLQDERAALINYILVANRLN